MVNIARIIGRNIEELMYNKNVSIKEFSNIFGFSKRDTYRIIEGKCFLPPYELRKISNYFNVNMKSLLKEQENYNISSLQYVSKFQDKENLDMILNLMDEYVELLETI